MIVYACRFEDDRYWIELSHVEYLDFLTYRGTQFISNIECFVALDKYRDVRR